MSAALTELDLSGLPFTWQVWRVEIGDPALCLRVFKSNRDAGLLLFAGLLVDAVRKCTKPAAS